LILNKEQSFYIIIYLLIIFKRVERCPYTFCAFLIAQEDMKTRPNLTKKEHLWGYVEKEKIIVAHIFLRYSLRAP
jgi:hypothetical protein